MKDLKEIKEILANNLRYYREQKRVTQRELAAKLGIRNNTISSWENGTNSIDVAVLMQICEILEITLDEIYFGENNNNSLKELSDREQHILLLFRKLPAEEQLKFIGRLEMLAEITQG